jgi:hypothetical protein
VCPVRTSSLPSLLHHSDEQPQAKTAWDLKKVWPELELHIVPDAGHYSRETGVAKLLVEVRPTPFAPDVPRSPRSQAADKFSSH